MGIFILASITTCQLFDVSAQSNFAFNSGFIYSIPNDNSKYINVGILGDFSSAQLEFTNLSSVNSYLFFRKSETILSNLEYILPINSDFEVYPTITTNLLHIKNNRNSNSKLIIVRIHDLIGREVFNTYLHQAINEIDVSSLNMGSYILSLNYNNSTSNYRFSIYK